MANNDTYYRKLSLDEIQDQGSVLYNVRGYSPNSQGREFGVAEPLFSQAQSNVYYPEHYPLGEPRHQMPFMYNTREDLMTNVAGITTPNYVVYGNPPNLESNMKVPKNINYVDQTNGNLSGLEYPIDYSDYNLFSNAGVSPMRQPFETPSPQGQDNSEMHTRTPHLIQNLVGHWGSGGNYTPFGSSVKSIGEFGSDRNVQKTRIVAEVRPMRPSYSDVLAKSAPNQKPGKQADSKTKVPEVKNGKGKSSVGRTLSGNAGLCNRQNSEGDEQSSKQMKILNTLKKWMDKNQRYREDSMKKKWVSLDDLNGGMNDSEFIREESTKKATAKVAPSKKQSKENWEPPQNNSGKTSNNKSPDSKRSNASGNGGGVPKVQPVSRDKEASVSSKSEATRSKPTDERKGVSPNKTGEGSKASRRNSRGAGAQSDKGKKPGGKVRRREQRGWAAVMAVVAHRLDLALACVLRAATWLVTLVLDVFALSTHLSFYMCTTMWESSVINVTDKYVAVRDWFRSLSLVRRLTSSRFWPFRRTDRPPPSSEEDEEDDSDSESGDGKKKRKRLPGGLKHNLPLPSTGDEAMKRLLACKGKDPYSILGVSQDCTDDDIKKYYKRQAFLVHPDKNNQPGAEEAFKILVHAFDIIGEPEHRKSYDRSVEKTAQAEQAWSELSDLLAQLHKKMEYVANTLRCTNCGKRHKRSHVNRPIYAARMCAQCNIHHSVREGDIWAETSMFGLMWRYYACMDGSVYDISEWAACQGGNLKNLKANTHQVQYRIVLGKHGQKGRSHHTTTAASGEPDLEEFINNLYTKPDSGNTGDGSSEARSRKHRRKK